MDRKRLAREWLYLLGFLASGLVLVPLLLFIVQLLLWFVSGPSVSPDSVEVIVKASPWWVSLGHMYLILWSSGIGWVLMLSPYLAFQVVRSVRWSITTLHRPTET